jgi:uncharacterized protein with gpF-like domain
MSQYKKLYNQGLKAYSPQFKKELQKQVDTFCRTQDLNAISSKDLKKTLYSLHLTYGTKMAENAHKSIKVGLKSNSPTEVKSGSFLNLVGNVIIRFLEMTGLNKLVNDITQTTKDQIKRFLENGVKEGKTMSQIISDLETAGITNYRAELIARTELARAMNAGSMVGAISTGLKTNKIWISTLDNRTRRIPPSKYDHWDMNGVEVPIDEYFSVYSEEGTDMMQYPGDPMAQPGNTCNCRCTIGYKTLKDANGNYISYNDQQPKGNAGVIWRLLNDGNNNDIYSLIANALQ